MAATTLATPRRRRRIFQRMRRGPGGTAESRMPAQKCRSFAPHSFRLLRPPPIFCSRILSFFRVKYMWGRPRAFARRGIAYFVTHKVCDRLTRMRLKISWVDHSQLVGMTMWLSRPEELASLACRKFSPTVENRGCSDQHAKVSLSMGAEGGDFASSLPVNLR